VSGLGSRHVLALVLTAGLGALAMAQGPEVQLPPGDSPPPTAADRVAAAGESDDYPDYGHVVVLDRAVNHVDEKGVSRVESEVLYKTLTEEGCRALSVLQWGYEPQSSAVEVEDVTVIRDGKTIPVPVEAVLDLPAAQDMIYWGNRTKLLQMPRLEVGDGIDVRSTRRGYSYALLDQTQSDDERFIPPMPGEYFDIVLFSGPVPILEKRYELRLPAAKQLHSQVYNGALYASTSFTEDENVYAWWAFDLEAERHEERQAEASDRVTKVVLATVESWEAKSRWFFSVNDGQFGSSPEIDRKVVDILAAAGVADGDDAAKAEALVHWVAQNIRYSGQTMGKGEGFTLHPGTMIFEQRSGVCKDIAGMLVTMMRAAGIATNPAMTMAGSRIEEVPADQFNHCVVAREAGDEWVMYDPTWVPFNNDIWSKLETEQHYLVGSAEGEPLRRIAYSPPMESPLRIRHQATLGVDGSLEGTIRFEGRGAMDSRLRRIVASTPIREIDERLGTMLASMCERVEVQSVRHRAADDFSGDMWIEVAYRAPQLALAVDGGLELHPPMMAVLLSDGLLFRAGATKWDEERTSDVFLYYTQLLDVEETIRLPAGRAATVVPASDEVDETYAYFKGQAEAAAGRLIIRTRAEVRRRQIPPEGYAGLRKAVEEARSWGRAVIRVEGEGGEG